MTGPTAFFLFVAAFSSPAHIATEFDQTPLTEAECWAAATQIVERLDVEAGAVCIEMEVEG